MGDFTSEKEQKLLESEAEVSNTEDTNADELTFEETSGFSDDDDAQRDRRVFVESAQRRKKRGRTCGRAACGILCGT